MRLNQFSVTAYRLAQIHPLSYNASTVQFQNIIDIIFDFFCHVNEPPHQKQMFTPDPRASIKREQMTEM